MVNPASWGRRLALVAMLGSATGLGQGSSDKATADALFDAARTDMEAEDYAAACPKLAESHRIDPGVGTLLNLGQCFEHLGKLASAWSSYREAATLAKREGQLERESFARAQSERLDHLLTRVVVVIGPEVREIPGLRVVWADKVVPAALFAVPFPVDPGTYTLTVSAPGYETSTLSVEARAEGETLAAEVVGLQRAGGSAARSKEAPRDPQLVSDVTPGEDEGLSYPSPSGSPSRGPGPWILGGVGLGFIGAGVGLALLGKSENDQALSICPDYESAGCSAADVADWRDYTSAARLDYTLSYVGLGVGGALLLGSVTWFALRGKGPRETAFQLQPRVSVGSYGFSLRGAF